LHNNENIDCTSFVQEKKGAFELGSIALASFPQVIVTVNMNSLKKLIIRQTKNFTIIKI